MNQRKLDTDAGHDGKTRTITRRRFVGAATAAALLGGASARSLGSPETAEAATASGVKLFSQFTRLPGKSIAPDGWLLRYAQINAEGWVMKHARDRLPSVWGRYVHRTANPKLGFTVHDEWIDAPDYGAYFGDSLVHYAGLSLTLRSVPKRKPGPPSSLRRRILTAISEAFNSKPGGSAGSRSSTNRCSSMRCCFGTTVRVTGPLSGHVSGPPI